MRIDLLPELSVRVASKRVKNRFFGAGMAKFGFPITKAESDGCSANYLYPLGLTRRHPPTESLPENGGYRSKPGLKARTSRRPEDVGRKANEGEQRRPGRWFAPWPVNAARSLLYRLVVVCVQAITSYYRLCSISRRIFTLNVDMSGDLPPQHHFGPIDPQGERSLERGDGQKFEVGLGIEVAFGQITEHGRIVVTDLDDRGRLARFQIGQRGFDRGADFAVAGGDRGPVWIGGGVAEQGVHARFQLFGQDMLPFFRFIVDLIPGNAQCFGQV